MNVIILFKNNNKKEEKKNMYIKNLTGLYNRYKLQSNTCGV